MVFCNKEGAEVIDEEKTVTILILIDGFLQFLRRVGDFNGK